MHSSYIKTIPKLFLITSFMKIAINFSFNFVLNISNVLYCYKYMNYIHCMFSTIYINK